MAGHDEHEFPEILELRQMQRKRHHQIIIGLVVGGVLSMAAGLAIFAFADSSKPSAGTGAVGIVLLGVGVLMILRGALSGLTRIDLDAKDDLVLPDIDLARNEHNANTTPQEPPAP